MNKKGLYIALAVTLLSGAAYAQEETSTEDTLKTRILTVIGYKPTISDASKLSENPTVIDTVLEKPEARFEFDNRQIETTYTPDTIKAAKMKGEPLNPLYRSYVKGGVGNGINYSLDAYVNALRSREGSLAADLHAVGTQGVLQNLPPAPYNRWAGSVYGKKFFSKHELKGRLGYDRERVQYYGYDDTNPYYFTYSEDVFKQAYSDVSGEVSVRSFYTDSAKINHTASLKYDYFNDLNNANNEHNVLFEGTASRFFGEHLGSIDLMTDLNANDYVGDFYNFPFDTLSEKRLNTIVALAPKVTSQAKKWRLEIGANAALDIQANRTRIHIYPDIYVKYNLVKEIIIPYGGVTGGLSRTNFKSLVESNPFLWLPATPLENTDRPYHIYGGVRGSFSDRFTFNLQGGQYLERNTPLFVNYDASQYNLGATRFGENYFTVEYDTIKTVEIGGELTYRMDEKLQVVGKGTYRSFLTQREFVAWHKPAYEVSITGFYQIKHKIIARASMNFYGPQWAKSYNPASEKLFGYESHTGMDVYGNLLAPMFDINIGGEYRYTERLSGFVSFNNVIAQRYQRWNQYPAQRFNILAGLTYSFWRD